MIELNLTATWHRLKDSAQGKLPEAKRKLRQLAPFLIIGLALLGLSGCTDSSRANSYGDCVQLSKTDAEEMQCLREFDMRAYEALATVQEAAIQEATSATQQAKDYETQQTQWAKEDETKEATKNASKHQLAIAQPGEGILDVLVRMGFNLEAIGPMNYSQIIAVTIDDQFRLVTLGELLNSDPNDPKYRLDIGACVITAPDQFGINQGIEENKDTCPTQ